MVQKDTQFVMKNHKVVQPFVPTDGLELYYDVKGKKNTDNYKDKLLDMSGNGRHGVLSNFAYEGVSGYRGTTEGGLLLDDVDDKIVRPAISGIEYTSASRNLFDGVFEQGHWNSPVYNTNRIRSKKMLKLESGKTYTFSTNLGAIDSTLSFILGMFIDEGNYYTDGVANPVSGWTGTDSYTFTPTVGTYMSILIKRTEDAVITPSVVTSAMFFQLEEGSVATPYTPYIPLPIMTYQMNGNILSFEKDGTVKRTTKDANGNEVVVSRKGINLVRNGNFANGKDKWVGGVKLASAIVDNSSVVLTANTESGEHYFDQNFRMPSPSSKYLVKSKIKSIIGRGYIVAYNYRLDGTYENLGRSSIVSEGVETEVSFIAENTTTHLVNPHIIVRLQLSNTSAQGMFSGNGEKSSFTDIQLINLTQAYGAGNEPDLAYIQSHPEEFSWTPNPNDLIEAVEIKNNLVGDLENLQGSDFEQHEDGVITYTNEAEEGSVVRVDIDGISDQPLRFRNATGEQVVITEHDQVDADAIKKVEFQGNSVQLADKYREVSGTSVVIAPELHDKNVADKLVIGGNTTQYTESSSVVTDGLEMWLSGRNFSNSPATTVWKDLTGVNNGTASGFAFTSASGSDGNGGVVFDGVDDMITLPISKNKYLTTGKEYQPVTMEIWAKAYSTTGIATSLFGRLGNHTGFRFEGSNIIARLWDVDNLSATVQAPVALNTTFHAVATFNNKVVRLYVNGVLIGQETLLGSYRWLAGDFFINGTSNFNGAIYSARFYSKALTNTEVLQNYNAGLSIPIPNIAMPQEVRHVNSGSKVLVHGKNLVSETVNWNSVGIYDNALVLKLSNLKPSTQYTLSFEGTVGNYYYTNEKLFNQVSLWVVSGRTYVTVTTKPVISMTDGNQYISNQGWRILKNYQVQPTPNTFINTQFEEGSTATAYEPYTQTEVTIPVTLRSIG